MNARTRALALGLSLGVALAVAPSCGPTQSGSDGGESGDDAGTPSGAAVTSFCHDYASAYCSGLVQCKYLDSNAQAACVSWLEESECGLSSVSVLHGYATFDPAKAAACMQALSVSVQGCELENLFFPAPPCDGLVTPQSGTGQACLVDTDCKDAKTFCTGSGCNRTCQTGGGLNQRCTLSAGTGCNAGLFCNHARGGVCEALLPAGSPCNKFESSCVPSAYCDAKTSACVALPAGGQPCLSSSPTPCAEDATCNYSATPGPTCEALAQVGQSCAKVDCVPAAYCDGSLATATCVARKPAGASCSQPDACVPDVDCLNGTCTPKSPEGGPCTSSIDCAGLRSCDALTRTCLSFREGTEGDSCTNDVQRCADGFRCVGPKFNPDGGVGTVGVCKRPKLGASCSTEIDCPPHALCVTADGGSATCVTGTLGMECSSTWGCPAGAYCTSNPGQQATCVNRIAEGGACTGDDPQECRAPLRCIATDGGGGTCTAPGTTGDPCTASVGSCKLFHVCGTNGTCEPWGLNGQPCSNEGLCLSGACNIDSATKQGTCGPTHIEGQQCVPGIVNPAQCAGVCDSSTQSCATCQ